MAKGIDVLHKLFGTPARVKVMRLFLLNSGQGFLPKDISKKTKTNPSAIRKELALLLSINFIKKKSFISETSVKPKKSSSKTLIKRKKNIGWFLDESFEYLKQMKDLLTDADFFDRDVLISRFKNSGKVKLLIVSGIFIQSTDSRADILLVGDNLKKSIVEESVRSIEAEVGRELSYAVFTTAEFLYRTSMYDKLVCDMLDFPHETLIDTAKLSTSIIRKP